MLLKIGVLKVYNFLVISYILNSNLLNFTLANALKSFWAL